MRLSRSEPPVCTGRRQIPADLYIGRHSNTDEGDVNVVTSDFRLEAYFEEEL